LILFKINIKLIINIFSYSDLDIVCFIKENSPDILKRIAQLLHYHRISEERPITLTKAVVPIIKFREFHTQFNVDISFNQSSGYTSSRSMKNYLDQWPSLGSMVIIVKWFLKHHGLDDPSNGGMGGFTVFCMMLSFFQVRLNVFFFF
jgi:non-canonical poly(A) RNA polymerase PAPD5/7